MKPVLISFVSAWFLQAAVAAEPAPNSLSAAEAAAGWQLLFDGEDASEHWRGYGKDKLPDEWVAEEGALVRKGGGDIITKKQYESFELSLDWKISEGGNSGVMFKVLETEHPSYRTGPEAQIQDNVKGTDPQKAGWMYQLYAADKDTTKPVGEWNNFVIKCRKTAAGTYRCTHWMNGEKYVDYEIGSEDWKEKLAKSKFANWEGFGTADAGHICLQDHGNLVWFRNLKIRELDSEQP